MSVIILGGCGEIGRYIAKDLVKSGFNVTIADLREFEGKMIAKRLGNKASFLKLDIRDFDTLVEELKEHKLVINIIGPYFEFGDWIPRAAIQAGINYLDICDDHDITVKILNLNKRVEREGLTFLINMGASPGLTNIMAKIGSKELDEVSSIRVLWYEDTGEDIGLGALMHWAHIAMGKIPIYRNGKWINVKALSEREIVKFPNPCGLIPIYYVGHPEPITIPWYIDTNEVICKGGVLPDENILLTQILDRLILVKHVKLIKLICKFFLRIFPLLVGKAEEREVLSGFRSDVIGQRQQKNLRISLAVVGAVTNLTSMPASIAAQMIVENNKTTPGVFPPEGCPDLNINKMISELEKRQIYLVKSQASFP